MLKKESTDITRWDTAVELCGVTKIFTQWHRENTGKGLLRSLIKPQRKTVSALDDVSFNINRGEFVAYAGPNGAGKSTTMKILCGMLQQTEGQISVFGLSPDKNRIHLMKKIGVLFGNRTELWWDHPVSQSFEWKKTIWDIPDDVYRRNLDAASQLLDIDALYKTFVRDLSFGQRMRADLAMMLLHSPELILLDEPTLGLDVVAKRQIIEYLKRINKENGVTIIVTSHDMDDLEQMAQRILMISGGKIAYDGDFIGLRKITGSLTRFTVTADCTQPPELAFGSLIKAENGVFEYEADLIKHPVRELLRQLSEIEGVRDIEIQRAPIEQVIAELYGKWKEDA